MPLGFQLLCLMAVLSHTLPLTSSQAGLVSLLEEPLISLFTDSPWEPTSFPINSKHLLIW